MRDPRHRHRRLVQQHHLEVIPLSLALPRQFRPIVCWRVVGEAVFEYAAGGEGDGVVPVVQGCVDARGEGVKVCFADRGWSWLLGRSGRGRQHDYPGVPCVAFETVELGLLIAVEDGGLAPFPIVEFDVEGAYFVGRRDMVALACRYRFWCRLLVLFFEHVGLAIEMVE